MSNEKIAQSIADMVTEWVEGGIRGGTDWRNGLAVIIEKRLDRFKTLQPIATADKDAERLTLAIVRNGVLEELHLGGFRYAINDDEVSCWWSDQADDEIVPTHWMPAPASPTA